MSAKAPRYTLDGTDIREDGRFICAISRANGSAGPTLSPQSMQLFREHVVALLNAHNFTEIDLTDDELADHTEACRERLQRRETDRCSCNPGTCGHFGDSDSDPLQEYQEFRGYLATLTDRQVIEALDKERESTSPARKPHRQAARDVARERGLL